MDKIAVDTSFLIFMVKRKIDINRINELFSGPIELYTSKGVINELENIINSEKRDASYAKLALSLLKKLNLEIIENKNTPDDWLMKQKIIATVDIPLSKKAQEKGVRVINITKSNKLILR
jgi:rRNA-processing protein FCF1